MFDVRTEYLNRGLSRVAFGEEIGVPEYTLRRFEDGLGIHPSNAKKIADYFGVTVTELLERDTKDAA